MKSVAAGPLSVLISARDYCLWIQLFSCYMLFVKVPQPFNSGSKNLRFLLQPFVNIAAVCCSLEATAKAFGIASHSYLSNPLISFPPAGCWMLIWNMNWAGPNTTKWTFPCTFPLYTKQQTIWSSKFHFAIIKLTTISQHSNHTIMNFQKQLKALSVERPSWIQERRLSCSL